MWFARGLSRAGVWFGGALMVAAALVIGVEVVIRKLFNLSVGGADELSGYALAIGSAWAFGFTLLDRSHVRIDSLYVLLPAPLCAALDLLALVVFGGFMTLVTWHGYGVLRQSIDVGARSMSPLATPLVAPQLLWVLGLVVASLVSVILLVRALPALVRGDFDGVQRLIGSRTLTEELEEELAVAAHAETREVPR